MCSYVTILHNFFYGKNANDATFELVFDLCCINGYNAVSLPLHYNAAAAGTLFSRFTL